MPEWLARLDIWLVAISLGFLAWLESRALRRKIGTLWGWLMAWNEERSVNRLRSVSVSGGGGQGGSYRFAPAPNRPAEPDTHQIEPASLSTEELINNLTDRGLTREQLLTLLAKVKKMDGDLWLSANRISATIGGTNADNLAAVRTIRGDAAPAHPSPPAARLERPRNGW